MGCFNYAAARKDPRGLRELLLVNGDCTGANLRTSRSFQKQQGLECTRFPVILQQSAGLLQEPELWDASENQLRYFCKCAIAGANLIIQKLETHCNV